MRSRMGRPATRSIGLGTSSVSGRSRRPEAAGHDHGPVVARRVAQEPAQEVERDRAARGVDGGDRGDPAGAHQVQRIDPRLARVRRPRTAR